MLEFTLIVVLVPSITLVLVNFWLDKGLDGGFPG